MTSVQLYRLSGGALVIGAVLSALSAIVSGVLFPDSNSPEAATNTLNVLLSAIGVVGTIFALFGLPGLYAHAAGAGGLIWLIGVVLIAITAMIFGIFLGLMSVIVFPVLASRAPDVFGAGPPPAFFALFIVGTVANVFGALLMGIPMITKRLYPRWCGYLLIVAAALAVVGFIVGGPGPSSLLSQIVGTLVPLPLFAALGWAGYELWSVSALANEARARSVTTQPA
jgi:hypothetical protein